MKSSKLLSLTIVIFSGFLIQNTYAEVKPGIDTRSRDVRDIKAKDIDTKVKTGSTLKATESREFRKAIEKLNSHAQTKSALTEAKMGEVFESLLSAGKDRDADALSEMISGAASGKMKEALKLKTESSVAEEILADFLRVSHKDQEDAKIQKTDAVFPISPSGLKKILEQWDPVAIKNLKDALSETTKAIESGKTVEEALKQALKLLNIDFEDFKNRCKKV